MRPIRFTTSLLAALILVATTLVTAAPRARAQASGPTPLAVATALSPASGHLFALTTLDGGTDHPGNSWVTMLDAKTRAILHTVTIGQDFNQVLVDDSTQHVFVLTGQSYAKEPQAHMVTLDTRTGAIFSRASWGAGMANATLSGKPHYLWVFLSTRNQQPMALYVLDPQTSQPLHRIPWARDGVYMGLHEGAGHIFIPGPDGLVRVYDMQTWEIVTTFQLKGAMPQNFPTTMIPTEKSNGLLLVSGKQANTVSLVDARTGTYRWTVQMTSVGVWNMVVDEQTNRAFAVSRGTLDLKK